MDSAAQWSEVRSHVRDTVKLESAVALLEWDDRTYLPAKGGDYRADQITLLSGMIHHRRTDQRLGERLTQLCDSDLVVEKHSPVAASILRLKKDYDRYVRLPVELVEAIAKATVLGQQAWEVARAADDWHAFEPHLRTIIGLKRREAELLCEQGGALYDALLDQYEEGAKAESLTTIFATLRDSLVELVKQCGESKHQPDGYSWKRSISLESQRATSRWIAQKIGYSFDRGRLDETSHPFCTTLGPDDCRILTRYQTDYFPSGFYGTLHEAGHGIYEQGLPTDCFGLPAGAAASLGVHESQSRLWENFVGRSSSFWQWCLPEFKSRMPGSWDDLNPLQIFRDANRVQPSLIRVEADEVTYNLHILIRFELEQEFISGVLAVEDIPQAWNDRYQRYLGIRPDTFANGVLQDVHWSAGLIGYFPTYTLGNIYAAQLVDSAQRTLGNLGDLFKSGDFSPVLEWLRVQVHAHGRCYHPGQLIQQATGSGLSSVPLTRYLHEKLKEVYTLA